VTVRAGEQAMVEALLVDQPAAPPKHSAFWKWSLGTGIAVTVGGAAFAYYAYSRTTGVKYLPDTEPGTNQPVAAAMAPDASDCHKSFERMHEEKLSTVTDRSEFRGACIWKPRIYFGYMAGGVGAVVAVASLIVLTRAPGSEHPATGTRSGKPSVAIAPMVSPDA